MGLNITQGTKTPIKVTGKGQTVKLGVFHIQISYGAVAIVEVAAVDVERALKIASEYL